MSKLMIADLIAAGKPIYKVSCIDTAYPLSQNGVCMSYVPHPDDGKVWFSFCEHGTAKGHFYTVIPSNLEVIEGGKKVMLRDDGILCYIKDDLTFEPLLPAPKPESQYKVGQLVWFNGDCRRIEHLTPIVDGARLDGDNIFTAFSLLRPVRVGDEVITTDKSISFLAGHKTEIIDIDKRAGCPICVRTNPSMFKDVEWSTPDPNHWVYPKSVRLAGYEKFDHSMDAYVYVGGSASLEQQTESHKVYLALRGKLSETNRRLNNLEERIKTIEEAK